MLEDHPISIIFPRSFRIFQAQYRLPEGGETNDSIPGNHVYTLALWAKTVHYGLRAKLDLQQQNISETRIIYDSMGVSWGMYENLWRNKPHFSDESVDWRDKVDPQIKVCKAFLEFPFNQF